VSRAGRRILGHIAWAASRLIARSVCRSGRKQKLIILICL
jgi:hypothetical protein